MGIRQILVVFDLDGTLIDSRADLAASTNDAIVSFGAAPLPPAQLVTFVGEGARVLVARALRAAGLPDTLLDEALARFLQIYGGRLMEVTRPYDGIAEVVTRAGQSGVALGVITNKPQSPTDRLLHAFGLASSFRWVIGGDTAFPRKPDPASLIWMMNEAGRAPASTLFVGDSEIDADTARGGGAWFCLAAYGFGQERGVTTLRPGELSARGPRNILAAIDAVRAR